MRILEETYEPGATASYVARLHNISAAQLFQWRRKYQEGTLTNAASEENLTPESEHKKSLERVKRFKMDYAYVSDLSTADRVREQLPGGRGLQ